MSLALFFFSFPYHSFIITRIHTYFNHSLYILIRILYIYLASYRIVISKLVLIVIILLPGSKCGSSQISISFALLTPPALISPVNPWITIFCPSMVLLIVNGASVNPDIVNIPDIFRVISSITGHLRFPPVSAVKLCIAVLMIVPSENSYPENSKVKIVFLPSINTYCLRSGSCCFPSSRA